MNHLTDRELINHVVKFDTDPIRVRLATYMERMQGAILDDLLDAGMDDTYCTFRSEWGGDYHPGRYIIHLEEEIKIRDDTIAELQEELDERRALSIADLIEELRQEVRKEQYTAQEARNEKYRAEVERDDAKSKLSMWNHLRTP